MENHKSVWKYPKAIEMIEDFCSKMRVLFFVWRDYHKILSMSEEKIWRSEEKPLPAESSQCYLWEPGTYTINWSQADEMILLTMLYTC
jgi:hypothetical protein